MTITTNKAELLMRHYRYLLSTLLLIVTSACAAPAPTDGFYTIDPSRSNGGTGRFYMDREISDVMGHLAADWLERPSRTHEEMPDEVVANMGLKPTDVVADIGAGSGYFSVRIAKQVPQGRVLAVDIQPEMLEILEGRRREEGLDNINGVLGEIDDTHLPENSVDVAFLVDAYHEFSHPREMLQSIYDSLKPGGRLILVEYRAEDPNVPIRTLHKMTQRQVRREMSVLNFEWEKTLDFLPWQHMMFFTKPE